MGDVASVDLVTLSELGSVDLVTLSELQSVVVATLWGTYCVPNSDTFRRISFARIFIFSIFAIGSRHNAKP